MKIGQPVCDVNKNCITLTAILAFTVYYILNIVVSAFHLLIHLVFTIILMQVQFILSISWMWKLRHETLTCLLSASLVCSNSRLSTLFCQPKQSLLWSVYMNGRSLLFIWNFVHFSWNSVAFSLVGLRSTLNELAGSIWDFSGGRLLRPLPGGPQE